MKLKEIYKKLKDFVIKDEYSKIPEEKEALAEVERKDIDPIQLRKAKMFHGMHEVRDNKKLSRLLGFDPAKTPWCAGFVNAIEKACGRKGTDSLLARSFLKYGKRVALPKPGDIVILKRGRLPWQGHVGYYISDHGGKRLLILGGNQNNKVCYKYYPINNVLGYRRPE